jgi:hypothetical protein
VPGAAELSNGALDEKKATINKWIFMTTWNHKLFEVGLL